MFNSIEESIKIMKLEDVYQDDLNVMNEEKVEFRKKQGILLYESRQDAKNKDCFYCGEKQSSFCNSHSIPEFILRNIAVNGKVYSSNKLISLSFQDEDKGLKNSGTFQLIC